MLSSARELSDVLRRVAADDQAAFETLYDATCAKLYGTILRIVGNRSSADEILQDVYVRIWQHSSEFVADKASPITWMTSIARNRAIDELRKGRGTRTVELTDSTDVASDEEEPLAGAERSEAYRALLACLQALEPEKRQMILLAYYRGLSRADLAKRFDRPIPTVKTWLHRGLSQLRACLAS